MTTVDNVMSFVIRTDGPITRASEKKIGREAYERNYLSLQSNESWKIGFERTMDEWRRSGMTPFGKQDLVGLLGTSSYDRENRILRALYDSI